MSDMPPSSDYFSSAESENKLMSDQFEEFKEALEVLYVSGNLSGRVKFAQSWAAPASYLLGDELIRQDMEGTQDKERRAELEEQAEERRLALLEFMDGVERNSVHEGTLQIDYVRGAIEKMGRPISLLIYGQKIVDRFAPPTAEELAAASAEAEMEGGVAADVSQEAIVPEDSMGGGGVPPAFPMPEEEEPSDPMDRIRPIDMDVPVAAAPVSVPQPQPQPQPQEPELSAGGSVRSLETPVAQEVRSIEEAPAQPESLSPLRQEEKVPEEALPQVPVQEPPQSVSPPAAPVSEVAPSVGPAPEMPVAPVMPEPLQSSPQPEEAPKAPQKSVSGTVTFVSSKDIKDKDKAPPEGDGDPV
ncbi:MAG: hypothetical protein R3E13_07315 [Alphaproteobacteria bacterium]